MPPVGVTQHFLIDYSNGGAHFLPPTMQVGKTTPQWEWLIVQLHLFVPADQVGAVRARYRDLRTFKIYNLNDYRGSVIRAIEHWWQTRPEDWCFPLCVVSNDATVAKFVKEKQNEFDNTVPVQLVCDAGPRDIFAAHESLKRTTCFLCHPPTIFHSGATHTTADIHNEEMQ